MKLKPRPMPSDLIEEMNEWRGKSGIWPFLYRTLLLQLYLYLELRPGQNILVKYKRFVKPLSLLLMALHTQLAQPLSPSFPPFTLFLFSLSFSHKLLIIVTSISINYFLSCPGEMNRGRTGEKMTMVSFRIAKNQTKDFHSAPSAIRANFLRYLLKSKPININQ